VNGTQININKSSAMAKFKMRILVVLLICFWKRIVSKTSELPIMPTINVILNVTATSMAIFVSNDERVCSCMFEVLDWFAKSSFSSRIVFSSSYELFILKISLFKQNIVCLYKQNQISFTAYFYPIILFGCIFIIYNYENWIKWNQWISK